jgi:hypothetical protein
MIGTKFAQEEAAPATATATTTTAGETTAHPGARKKKQECLQNLAAVTSSTAHMLNYQYFAY